jgi:hypothetical protein
MTTIHMVTFVVAPPITYETSASLTIILKRDAHLTSVLIFLNFQSNMIMCGISFTSLIYLFI